jgi:hypothetical protein
MFEVTIKQNIKPDLILNAFVGAFEGGSNYWLREANLDWKSLSKENTPDPKRNLVWWGHENLYTAPFKFEVGYDDPEGEGYDDSPLAKKVINYPADVQKGLELMAEKSPSHFADLIKENDDSITHDVLIQYVILGDIVYG